MSVLNTKMRGPENFCRSVQKSGVRAREGGGREEEKGGNGSCFGGRED